MTAYRAPSELAVNITQTLREEHRRCDTGHVRGGCHLADLSTDDVQEILDLAACRDDLVREVARLWAEARPFLLGGNRLNTELSLYPALDRLADAPTPRSSRDH